MPIRLFPSLRNEMAKMLVEFDGTKQIELPPSTLPKWILEEEGKLVDRILKFNIILFFKCKFMNQFPANE